MEVIFGITTGIFAGSTIILFSMYMQMRIDRDFETTRSFEAEERNQQLRESLVSIRKQLDDL